MSPYRERRHIRVFVKSKEPLDLRLRLKFLDDEWKLFNQSIWNVGYAYFRLGGFITCELDLPEVGVKVVFMHSVGESTELYLMDTIDGCFLT